MFSAAVIIAVALAFLLPLSFSDIVSPDAEMLIQLVEFFPADGRVTTSTKEYIFTPDSAEHEQLRQALDNYSYHRSLSTFLSGNNTLPLENRFYINLFSGENVIKTGEADEIKVNHRVYRVGYFGSDAAFAMTDELKSILDAAEPTWQHEILGLPHGQMRRS